MASPSEQRVIDLLKSWESGYLAPSAQMVMKEARELIEKLIKERELNPTKTKGKKNG